MVEIIDDTEQRYGTDRMHLILYLGGPNHDRPCAMLTREQLQASSNDDACARLTPYPILEGDHDNAIAWARDLATQNQVPLLFVQRGHRMETIRPRAAGFQGRRNTGGRSRSRR